MHYQIRKLGSMDQGPASWLLGRLMSTADVENYQAATLHYAYHAEYRERNKITIKEKDRLRKKISREQKERLKKQNAREIPSEGMSWLESVHIQLILLC